MKTDSQVGERGPEQCCHQAVCSVDLRVTYSMWPAHPLAGHSAHAAWNQTQHRAAEGYEKEMECNGGEFRKNISRHTAHFQIGHDGPKQWN